MPPLLFAFLYWIAAAITLWLAFKVGVLLGKVLPRHRVMLWVGGPPSVLAKLTIPLLFITILVFGVAATFGSGMADGALTVAQWLAWASLAFTFVQGIADPAARDLRGI